MITPFTINGWQLYMHPLFRDQLDSLKQEVKALAKKDPEHFSSKKPTKKLKVIHDLVFKIIPNDPTLPEYRQGATLGNENKHWFRAKFFQQYRLFFRYHLEKKIIIYVWVNDDNTKRAYDKNTDAYAVFKKMLKNGNPPNNWDDLLKEATLLSL